MPWSMLADPTGWAPRWAGGCGLVMVALVSLVGEAGSAILLPGP